MVSRRQFLFGAAAGTVALSLPQGLTGKIVSALLSPSPTPAMPPTLTSNIAQGGFNGATLLRAMRDMAQRGKHSSYDFVAKGDMWHLQHDSIVRDAIDDLVQLIGISRIKDLEAARLEVQKWCQENIKHLKDPAFNSTYYYGPISLMDKITSHEAVTQLISERLDRAVFALAQIEKTRPSDLPSYSIAMDDIHMVWNKHSSTLQNSTSYCGRGDFFEEETHKRAYNYTSDNLKFRAELHFLHGNHFLARAFTLPEQEQSILDTFEANPANWAQLIRIESKQPNGDNVIDHLNAAFPKRAENVRIYESAIEEEEKRHDYPRRGHLPQIDVPWNIVVQMQDRPDAFMPIMQTAIAADRYRSFNTHHREKITFTQTAPSEKTALVIQGIVRGFFATYPDKKKALELLSNAFSAAVNVIVDGDDILLEAKSEMNEQDRLLLEDLSGMELNQMAFTIPLKEPAPT